VKEPALTEVDETIAALKRMRTRRDLDNLARFGIDATKPIGVSMSNMQKLAKRIGRNHQLAAALWASGWYEARMLATLVDDPALVTTAQMDRWCRDFDNWAICDTACFKLFDRSPHAWPRIAKWSANKQEFMKRAAFALIASLALHDKTAADSKFARCLPLIEKGARDDRNFVKKGVSWALRGVGRRSAHLRDASLTVARRLAASPEPSARWVGRDALRDLRGV
jgi:3-methyladenine DNA glycosylase AlkD